jgi:uncharacterized membrane protein HdeD (DUF308 family)
MTWKITVAITFLGATLAVAGIAGFIEATAHHPDEICRGVLERDCYTASGLSPTTYDLLRIGSWALVIFGALLIIVGLMRYWAEVHRA